MSESLGLAYRPVATPVPGGPPTERFGTPERPSSPSPAGSACVTGRHDHDAPSAYALSLGKYLRRRSPWEAHAGLDAARNELWKLVAVSLGVRDPRHGVTSILDSASELLPAAMRATVSELNLDAIATAAHVATALLAHTARQVPSPTAIDFPTEMLAYVAADLAALITPRPRTELRRADRA